MRCPAASYRYRRLKDQPDDVSLLRDNFCRVLFLKHASKRISPPQRPRLLLYVAVLFANRGA